MRVLILGGTVFLGRALVEASVERGHDVTYFHRGRTNPELFADTERATRVTGDRDGGLEALGDGPWDAVLDVCGYVPRIVRQSAEYFARRAAWYGFVSTVSVYADLKKAGITEEDATGVLEAEKAEAEEVTGKTYGPLKALCEQEVELRFGGRAFVPRPGIIVGPHDPTDRFTWWVARVARGGEVLAPAPPEQPVQVIDVRDLSTWIVAMAEERRTGVMNAVGPERPLTMEEMLRVCREVIGGGGADGGGKGGGDASITWVDGAFLAEKKVGPWMELPLWVGPGGSGVFRVKADRARAAGLRYRSLEETVLDTLRWQQTRGSDHVWRAGLAPDKERTLLEHWKER